MAGVILCGSMNRILYKIMTTPMGKYSFFLGVWNGFAYVLLYGTILFIRIGLKIVPKEHLTYTWGLTRPKDVIVTGGLWERLPIIKFFVFMGLMDGLGNILGLIAAPHLSGTMLSLLSQTIVIFSICCSLLFLNARYTYWQVFCAMVVLTGGIIALVPQLKHGLDLDFMYAVVQGSSTLPGAISFTLKELVFQQRKKEAKDLDLFIVNSHGSLFQLLFQPLFIPLCVLLGVTDGAPIGKYLIDGLNCFIGNTPDGLKPHTCDYSLISYLIYIGVNLTYNILLLLLVKQASSLLSFMALKASLPIAVVLFLLPWPIIGPSTPNPFEIVSLFVIIGALVFYRVSTIWKDTYKLKCCSFFLPCCGDTSDIKI